MAAGSAAAGSLVDAADIGLAYASIVRGPGLPYGISDQLWTVEADDVVATAPFSEQLLHAPEADLRIDEMQQLASRVRFVSKVTTWGPGVARAFAGEAAARALHRLSQALQDALRTIGPAATEGANWNLTDGELDAHEWSLALVRDMSASWLRAVEARKAGDLIDGVRCYARAAAETRGASGAAYTEELRGDSGSGEGLSYLESRRWQARILLEYIDGVRAAPTGPSDIRVEPTNAADYLRPTDPPTP
ncbi:MAG: hypothetical protein WBM72_02715 [Actinomycetota bacterium]